MSPPMLTDVNVPVGIGDGDGGQHASVASVRTPQENPVAPELTDVKVPAGGAGWGESGQHTSVWSVLRAQPKPPPTLTSVNVPAGGETGVAKRTKARPQQARV